MTRPDLINRAATMKQKNPDLRYGQALMNALSELSPELYETISNTEADCFYDDNKIAKFYVMLADLMEA